MIQDICDCLSRFRTLAVCAALAATVTACRDDIPFENPEELERTEDVVFAVANAIDEWKDSRTSATWTEFDDWTTVPDHSKSTVKYPLLFIEKGTNYEDQSFKDFSYTNPDYVNPDPSDPTFKPDVEQEFHGTELYVPGKPYPDYRIPMAVTGGTNDLTGALRVRTSYLTDNALAELRGLASRQTDKSRSTIVDESNINEKYANISVTAICYNGDDWMADRNNLVRTIDNEKVVRNGDRWNTTLNNYYWNIWSDDYNRVRFFSYAPYDAPGLSKAEDAPDGTPQFDFTVAEDVDDQFDLSAIAVTTPGNFQRTVPLDYNHILTGVRFLVDDEHMATCLRHISLYGVHGSGRYTYSTSPYDYTDNDDYSNPNINPDVRPGKPGMPAPDQDVKKGTWTPLGEADAKYDLDIDEGDFYSPPTESEFTADSDEGDDYWCVTRADRMFMLMPQDLPQTATI